jgi:preprotein translocase subunit SecE
MVLAVSAAVSVYIAIFDYAFGLIAKFIKAG